MYKLVKNIEAVILMKKFLRRTLGALALIGTSFGAKASNADEKQHENVIQNVNIDSKVNREKNNRES